MEGNSEKEGKEEEDWKEVRRKEPESVNIVTVNPLMTGITLVFYSSYRQTILLMLRVS